MVNYTLHLGDCLEYLRTLPDGSVDAVITDPPYGCGKADWDDSFPMAWYADAKRVGGMVCIITGSSGLKDSVALVGDDFVDIIAARNLNNLTRGPLGFNNWIGACVAGTRPIGNSWNFFEFAVRGEMPDHPTPKPIEYMCRLLLRTTAPGATVLDPFMGSGTTGVACMQTGRNFIGCEIDPGYFAIAKKRIEDAAAQPPLIPHESEPKHEQEALWP